MKGKKKASKAAAKSPPRRWYQRAGGLVVSLARRATGRRGPGIEKESVRIVTRRAQLLSDRGLVKLQGLLELHRPVQGVPHGLKLAVTSKWEFNRLKSVSKEPWTIAWIEEYLRPGDVFYDIGANVGAYALLAALATQRRCQVYAFEPGFATFASLCKNILLNECQDCVVPLSVALNDTTGLVAFKYRSVSPGAALHALGDRPVGKEVEGAGKPPSYTQPLLGYRLDDLIETFQLPLPQHIKLDVDGAEFAVLRGAERTLQDARLVSLLLEINLQQQTQDDVAGFLGRCGLHPVGSFRKPGKDHAPTYGLFARQAMQLPDVLRPYAVQVA